MVNSIDFDVPGLSDGNLLKHFVFEIESLYFFSAFQQYGNLLNRFAIEKYRKFLRYTTEFALFLFRSLSAVFGAGLFSVGYACSIQCTSDDMISGTRQVLNSSSTDKNNAVLLKVVSLSRNVACYLDAVVMTNSGDLSKS